MPFKPTYLYVKTHSVTGLKYFGKTTRTNPHLYSGSGDYWLKHLRVHGKQFSTEIIGFYTNKKECIDAALTFSKKHNIVESKEWANFRIENGIDGGSDLGHKKSNTRNMAAASSRRAREQVKNGTHPFQGTPGSALARNRNKALIDTGQHNFQGIRGSIHATELNRRRIEEGSHNLVKRPDGSSLASERAANGTHNWQKNKNTVAVVDKLGNHMRIPKSVFWSQIGPKENWDFVGITSKIAQSRLTRTSE